MFENPGKKLKDFSGCLCFIMFFGSILIFANCIYCFVQWPNTSVTFLGKDYSSDALFTMAWLLFAAGILSSLFSYAIPLTMYTLGEIAEGKKDNNKTAETK